MHKLDGHIFVYYQFAIK